MVLKVVDLTQNLVRYSPHLGVRFARGDAAGYTPGGAWRVRATGLGVLLAVEFLVCRSLLNTRVGALPTRQATVVSVAVGMETSSRPRTDPYVCRYLKEVTLNESILNAKNDGSSTPA